MIHIAFPRLPSYLSFCLPSTDELWDAPIRRRRYPKSRALSLIPRGQALYPFLSLGSGAGYIFMWTALTSGVLYITTYHGTVEYPTAPVLSHYTSKIPEPNGSFIHLPTAWPHAAHNTITDTCPQVDGHVRPVNQSQPYGRDNIQR
eukprot:9502685-Pyramimonas_sp.AAC.1